MNGSGCTFYKLLRGAYPGAKVVSGVRDTERRYESASKTSFIASRGGLRQLLVTLGGWRAVWVVRRILQVRTFGGKARDKNHTLAVLQTHNEDVGRTAPPERRLVYDVQEGWGPL